VSIIPAGPAYVWSKYLDLSDFYEVKLTPMTTTSCSSFSPFAEAGRGVNRGKGSSHEGKILRSLERFDVSVKTGIFSFSVRSMGCGLLFVD